MSEKKELPYYVVGYGLPAICLFLDIFLIATSGAKDESWLGHYFTWNWKDILGLVLFNAGGIGMGLWMIGVWKQVQVMGVAVNRLWAAFLAASILLILI